ncbi:hypothetical protein [Agitococcus lubricus]|uniref:START domain-containing protein n=1 Tax=Agitococcus lubricus TaxID=1077255 RepID=A0A2T5IVM5_9GAMM|nr:hypothetical protein [Agitococcus lubricus]PTQ87935.1 hypothetical protein C8N29_11520 [Agitococcus lubricus]
MLKQLCLSLCLLTLSQTALANRDLEDLRDTPNRSEWRLAKESKLHRIKVYVKNEDGQNIRSFRVVSTIDASIEALARVQSDFDNYKRWYFATLEVEFLQKVSDREYIYYIVHDAPIGTPDRDVVLRTVIEPMTPQRPYVFMRVSALPNFLAPRPPYVRMIAENYTVKWTPIDANTTLVESEGFINPGGNVPAWAINFAQSKGPFVNMMGLARQAQLPQYKDATTPLPFTFIEK